jgi:hypothetical protein
MKQTAVEWLAQEIDRRGPKENNPPQWLKELYDQAKEIEKQQQGYSEEDMKKAFSAGEDSKEDDINGDGETPFEEWFDQFGKNKMKELSKGKEVLLKIHQDKTKRINPCQAHNENNDNMDINIGNNYG